MDVVSFDRHILLGAAYCNVKLGVNTRLREVPYPLETA